MRLYFAHPVNVYNTPFENAVIQFILSHLSEGDEIENPNQPKHEAAYNEYAERFKHEPVAKGTRGMRYYHEVVLPSCGGCIALPFLDCRLGLGVASEVQWYLEHNKPAFLIEPTREITQDDVARFIESPETSSLFRIRRFTGQEVEMLLVIDTKVGNALVIPHEETRLRTWTVYNKVRRPYEEAHLVRMPILEGFYPEKTK